MTKNGSNIHLLSYFSPFSQHICNNRNILEYSIQNLQIENCNKNIVHSFLSTQHNPEKNKKNENLRISININCYNISSYSATSSSFIFYIVFSLKINLKRDYKHYIEVISLKCALFVLYIEEPNKLLLCIQYRVKVKFHKKTTL